MKHKRDRLIKFVPADETVFLSRLGLCCSYTKDQIHSVTFGRQRNSMKIRSFWDIAPCRLFEVYRIFRGA
jgi:hypothetical protein